MDFKEILNQNKALVWPEIEKYLKINSQFPDYCKIDSHYQPLFDYAYSIINEYPKRQGKYLRPTLLLLTAQSMGYSATKALKTAAAMQVSEDWILNHDDIEDDSLSRRGLPTLHRLFGIELAINAGDGLHNLMWKILRDNETVIGTTKTFEIMDEFFTMLNRTVIGQTIEIKWFRENKLDMTNEDLMLIMESKTGYYTIGGPMRLGAILAGANQSQLELIYRFGRILGIAFQIKDDLLDLTSTFGGQKTQYGNDIYEGKRTLMLVHLLHAANPDDKNKLLQILKLERSQKTKEHIDTVIKMMNQYGSLEYGNQLAKKMADDAVNLLHSNLQFLEKQPYRDQLESGINFIINRDH